MISKYIVIVFAAAAMAVMVVAGSSATASEKPAPALEARGNTFIVPTCIGRTIELNAEEKRTLDLHNARRKARGLKPFCVHTFLTKAARAHVRDMLDRDYFAHNSPEGGTPTDRLERSEYITRQFSYWTVGENIAWGSGDLGTPGAIFKAWINSDDHRYNIQNGKFGQIGIAVRRGAFKASDGQVYEGSRMYAAEFGARRERSR